MKRDEVRTKQVFIVIFPLEANRKANKDARDQLAKDKLGKNQLSSLFIFL